jgi:hypothetical protein
MMGPIYFILALGYCEIGFEFGGFENNSSTPKVFESFVFAHFLTLAG